MISGPSAEFRFLCRSLPSSPEGGGPPPAGLRWDRVLTTARESGVSALLHRTAAKGAAWPEPVRRALEEDYHRNLAENLLRLSALERVLEGFSRKGHPVILLKGVDLLDRLYGDPGARGMLDADLLLRPESCPEADALLASLGYRADGGRGIPAVPLVTGGLNSVLYRDPGTGFRIHLHWHIVNRTFPARAPAGEAWDMERLWGESVQAPSWASGARILSPVHLQVHLAAHGLKHGFGLLHVCEFSLAAARLVPVPGGAEGVLRAAGDFGQETALRWMTWASEERFGRGAAGPLSGRVPVPSGPLLGGFIRACIRGGRESSALGILAQGSPAVLRGGRTSTGTLGALRYLAFSARTVLRRAP